MSKQIFIPFSDRQLINVSLSQDMCFFHFIIVCRAARWPDSRELNQNNYYYYYYYYEIYTTMPVVRCPMQISPGNVGKI